MIRVLIERHCRPGMEKRLEGLLLDLRMSCMHQSAYVSGETLIKVDNPTTYLVVGTWTRLEGWQVWENSQERQELLQLVSVCLIDEPVVEVFAPATDDDDIFD